MYKTELVQIIAERMTLNKKDVKEVIDTALEKIMESVAKGEKVHLFGFGTFGQREIASRKVRSPISKDMLKIPAHNKPVFTASKSFKERVNK